MTLTAAERETILRFDEDERVLHLFTASPTQARRWLKRGIPLLHTYQDKRGEPLGWTAVVPLSCLRPLRALGPNGQARKSARQGPKRTIGRKNGETNTDG